MIKHKIIKLKLNIAGTLIRKRHGVSPILATVIIFGLIIVGVMVTFVQIVPYIEQAKSEEAVSTVSNSFIKIDTAIKSLLSESGTPGGLRTIFITKPSGKIDYDPTHHYISLRLLDQDRNSVHTIIDQQAISVLDWVYNCPRAIVPRGTTKYLTGPNPYEIREPVFLTGPFSSTSFQDLTNLTLTNEKTDRNHHIRLNYRVSIYVTIETQPEPEIRFQVFLILLSADFETLHSQYKQLTIRSQQNFSTPITLEQNVAISTLELVWDNHQQAGILTSSLWSTKSIQGLNQVSLFNVVIQTLIYKISIETS
ncbi:MAG: hypothetical protein ACFFAJ_01610 [Candidatus Hodarchaeota archaeon]